MLAPPRCNCAQVSAPKTLLSLPALPKPGARIDLPPLAGPADANLDTAITEAVKAEEDYLKGLMPQGAPLVGFGPSTPITESGKSTRPKTLWDK